MDMTKKLSGIIAISFFRDSKEGNLVQVAISRGWTGDRLYRRKCVAGGVSFPCGRSKTAEEWDEEFGPWQMGRLVRQEEKDGYLKEVYAWAKKACADRQEARDYVAKVCNPGVSDLIHVSDLMSLAQQSANDAFRAAWRTRYKCLA